MTSNAFILILARGGSKRIPRKALQKVGKLSLLENAIQIGHETGLKIVVSSDDEEILNIAKSRKAETISRPENLASDTATSVSAAIHAVRNLDKAYESVILLQVTNPFVTSDQILQAYQVHKEKNIAVFSAIKFSRVLWAWDASQPLFPRFQGVRSQDLTPVFLPAGAFFITKVKDLVETESFFKPKAAPFEIPEESGIDIDTPLDLELARYLWHQRL